ncbi:MAG: hypothetical protein OEZ02_02205 [Anaerolineae bacterium]|nr:hypothetical protein [Anaerolineae bacterium]
MSTFTSGSASQAGKSKTGRGVAVRDGEGVRVRWSVGLAVAVSVGDASFGELGAGVAWTQLYRRAERVIKKDGVRIFMVGLLMIIHLDRIRVQWEPGDSSLAHCVHSFGMTL